MIASLGCETTNEIIVRLNDGFGVTEINPDSNGNDEDDSTLCLIGIATQTLNPVAAYSTSLLSNAN